MLSLPALAALAAEHGDDLDRPVAPLVIAGRTFDVGCAPIVMGCVNLSRDSTYRDSIAPSAEAAVRRGRVLAAQGATLVDIGAESTTARAARVGADEQITALAPVVSELAAEGILVSAETYEPEVAQRCLEAGAAVINLTGAEHADEICRLAAEHRAAVILCYSPGGNVREITDVEIDHDPFPGLIEHFEGRIAAARAAGVENVVIDPGLGFYYGNLTDPATRARHQARVLLQSFRLRVLGVPICNALPHAFDLFEAEYRTAEGFFAVLATLGGSGVLRTHEVPQVGAVVRALSELG